MVNITYDDSLTMIATTADGTEIPYSSGDIAWVLTSSALVMIMSPGLGFFYSGLLRRKNALSQIMLSMAVYSVVAFQWFFWGYSLTFSPGSKFIGNLQNFGLMGVLEQGSAGSSRIPALVYCIYQSMFASLTAMIMLGATAERGRIGPALVFAFIWTTIVYDPIACWTWSATGWSYIMGTLDFAGGGPVHMSSGAGALAYSIWLGKRKGYGTTALAYKPQNTTFVVLGTALLWFGWFGFNGASGLTANLRAANAMVVTNIAAATGALTWMIMDWRFERKWSAVGLCSGVIAGLVGITPAAGYVGAPASLAIGILTAVACNYATKLKTLLRYDDTLDVFAVHGIGGFVGSLLTGIFADSRVASFDGLTEIPGGWINRNFVQLGYQLADSVAILAYAFTVTLILLVIMDYIPGLSLRVSEEAELIGIDEDQIGEMGYDYVAVRRDVDYGHHNFPHNGSASSPTASIHGEKKAAMSTAVPVPNDRAATAPTGHEAV